MIDEEKRLLTFELVSRVFPEARETFGRNGAEFLVHCPFPHRKGGRLKLYINEGGAYYCQDCGATGSAWESFFDRVVAKRYGHLHLVRDRQEPAGRTSGFRASRGKSVRWGGGGVLAPGKTVLLADLDEDHPAHYYLREERGLDPGEFASRTHPFAALYCLKSQFDLMDGDLTATGRVIHPVIQGGEPVGWTSRRIERNDGPESTEKEVWNGDDWIPVARDPVTGKWADYAIPKWFHLPSMRKSTILYNMDEASEFDVVVMSEGVYDVQKFGLFGVGYFGEVPSPRQINLIKNRFDRVIWVPDDGVDLSKRSFFAAVESISEACHLTVAKLPGRGDPGEKEVTRKETAAFLKTLLP